MSSQLPLVSIVTPSFNQGRFVEDTILSVKNQDYRNVEHIIVDGGSTDSTVEVLTEYEKEYNLRWVSERDRGQSDAVNKGLCMSKGDIIGWLNSDDVYLGRDVISFVVQTFGDCPSIDVLYGDNACIDQESFIIKVRHAPDFSHKRLLRIDYISQPSTFFRREVIQQYELDVHLDLPMDYEFWLRMAADGIRFKHVGKILAANRIHKSMKTRSRWEEMKTETRKVQERYGQKFGIEYQLFRLMDIAFFALLKIYGVRTVIEIYSNWEKQNMSFPARLDALPKLVWRQISHI